MPADERREVAVLAPTGTLGYGFNVADFIRCADEYSPSVIAVDAGSTDPGPYYLGAGVSFTSKMEIEHELEVIIGTALRLGVPVIVGSSGGAGADAHLEWTEDIVLNLAKRLGWSFKLATISSELRAEYVLEKLALGEVITFESGSALTADDVLGSRRIVAQMGPEPIVAALQSGAQVVLAGRSCDDALFAAYPISQGYDRGLATHMGKILECGAIACEPQAMDVMVGILRQDHFDVVPGSATRRCTVTSIAAHSLYEREDPVFQAGPGGAIDLSETALTQISPNTVRVHGTTWIPTSTYTVKMEGVKETGCRTISIAGIRCPSMIDELDYVLGEVRHRTERYFKEMGIEASTFRLLYHIYGRDGVMRELEPLSQTVPHEVGLVMEVVAQSQEISQAICHHVSGALLHVDYPGQFNDAGNLAFPYSPSEIPMGSVYEFSIYHLLHLSDPTEPFRTRLQSIHP
jgi:Acyclic terpene utilisation family protein AtuA